MAIQFATSDEREAAKRIRAAYPEREISDEALEPMLALVRDGVVRIQDPKMHGQVGVVPGDEWDGDGDGPRVMRASQALEADHAAD